MGLKDNLLHPAQAPLGFAARETLSPFYMPNHIVI
jgi:hypothetical protein